MAQNMYRVGDYVYFETYPSFPYQIRRIEELNKTASGTVEAKVACFYRRRELPQSLLTIADQAARQDQILSRPRRRLLSNSNNIVASTSNGESTSEIKENGVDPTEKTEASNGTETEKGEKAGAYAGLPLGAEQLSTTDLHVIRQHELFRARQIEILPATQIRGKCTVVLLSEVETCDMYLNQEDSFFYSLVYDPSDQTLLADKGKIEVGERYQAEIPDIIQDETPKNSLEEPSTSEENKENGDLMVDEEDEEQVKDEITNHSTTNNIPTNADKVSEEQREFAVFHPFHNLTDREIDQFLIVARAVGTFSRALDSSSTMKIPSLHMTTAAASRDVTILHAMALLHQANYDIGQATKFLVPPPSRQHYPLEVDKLTCNNTISLGGPLLIRDQLEEWSASETTLFEDALEKYGKDFHDIRVDCLPWKSLRDIIEFYYMWKTTARYAETHKTKLAEQENKLKQVYIPNYNKANPNLIGPVNSTLTLVKSPTPCESCKADESIQWYAWGPANLQMRLCNDCWSQWKKLGGIKTSHVYGIFKGVVSQHYDLDGCTDLAQNHSGRSNNGKNLNSQNVRGNISNRNNQTSGMGNVANKNNFVRGGPGLGNLPLGKSRSTFYLNSTLQARVARRIAPKSIFDARKAARLPFKSIDGRTLSNYYYSQKMLDILRVARQVRKGRLTASAIDCLEKLHQKHTMNGGSVGGSTFNHR